MSGSESESTRSSSEDETENVDLDEQQIKLTQMRRTARAKNVGKSKLVDKFSGLQSYEEMRRDHALQRMTEGVTTVLQLHTPYELSSICGVLGLSVKEKASTSLSMLLNYVKSDGDIQSEKLTKLLETMWEGALWEYLRIIGHPSSTMFLDPKRTVLRIWEEGGVLGGEGSFVPHFLVREVKKRYEWIKSPDIVSRLEKLRDFTEKVKRAELMMVSESDYTNIVKFLKNIKELRTNEEKMREFLIGEIEIARSRLDSVDTTLLMSRQDMADLERQLVVITDALNEKFAYLEFAAESKSALLEKKDTELHRLSKVLDSFIESHNDRMTPGGGTMQATKLRGLDDCSLLTREVFGKLTAYRDLRDTNDDELRQRCRNDIEYIDLLEGRLREVEEKAEIEIRRANRNEQRYLDAERDVKFCARKIMEIGLRDSAVKAEAWESSNRWMLRTLDCENRIRRTKRFLAAGIQDSDKTIIQLATAMNVTLQAIEGDELLALNETVVMARMDNMSQRHRRYLKELDEARRKGSKPKKTVVSATPAKVEAVAAREDDVSEVTGSEKSKATKKSGKKGDGKKGGDGKKDAKGDAKKPAAKKGKKK